jgi:glycosyltransferase involved in cell wall biosynthesis
MNARPRLFSTENLESGACAAFRSMSSTKPIPVTIIILTKNEEENLPKIAASIPWCDDVHVVDSLSTDGTLALAKSLGMKTWSNPFRGFGDQRNWALANCAIKHPWALFLDADEKSTLAFAAELERAVTASPDSVAGYYCCWKMIVEEAWLKRCDNFPKWQFRLLRVGQAHFADFGHGQKEAEVDGEILYLKEPYEHRPFSKGWADWLDRHNRYSTKEAEERVDLPFQPGQIFTGHGAVRNRALKGVVSRIPGWPIVRFCIPYFLKLGFLEGRVGFTYCLNLAYYEYLIQVKIREIKAHRLASPKPGSAA